MVDIPTIEPFQFIRSTAFSERVQLANKLNEVIDALNQIGTIDDLQTQIDAINSEISEIQSTLADTDSDVSNLTNQVNTLVSEVNGLLKEVVNEVVLDAPEYGQVRVKVIHEDEMETTSNALQIPVIVDGGISLISGTTARSFKIRYITADGVTHTTNDFVIPEGGGGTDVTVTSVTILEGDTDNSFKFEVGLSDGSSIQSNSYPFPAASELTPATTTQLGGIKVGTHLSVTADGTLSVDMTQLNTAAVASTVIFTADASKVTLHADSLDGSEFTEDIPQASQGGAGTIDQASYAKIAANESAISELEADVAALAPSVSVNEAVDPPTITVGINGKSAQAKLPSGGGNVSFETLNLKALPTDFKEDDILILFHKMTVEGENPDNWTSAPTDPTEISYLTQNGNYEEPFIMKVSSIVGSRASSSFHIMDRGANRYLKMVRLESFGLLSEWNDASHSYLMQVGGAVFNGGGLAYESQLLTITGSNVSRYFDQIVRVRFS